MSNYYDIHAQDFFENTINVNMQPLYDKFLPLLPAGARILDIGCGSGRDAKHFHHLGFVLSAFDASEKLVAFAKAHTGLNVRQCEFLNFHSEHAFSGMWACASLLHVPLNELPQTFAHLAQYLDQDGVFYCSFKYGHDEQEREGRRFTNLNENTLRHVLSTTSLEIKETWISGDQRAGRESERWLNALLIKTA